MDISEKNFMRRKLAAIATSSTVLFASGFLAAAPAQAASITVSDAACNGGLINGTPFSAGTGDVVTITADLAGCTRLQVNTRLVASASDIVVTGPGAGTPTLSGFFYVVTTTDSQFGSITITFTGTNSTIATFGLGSTSPNRMDWVVTYAGSGGGGGSSDSTASSSTPNPIFQQFGRPASGTCDAAAPATLNWSDVASGGWSESWAEWMNAGSGGAVCTRTLIYSTEQSRWIVG
jgi:hypothetical protein